MRCPPPVFAVQRPAQVKAELPQLKKPRKAARSPEYGDPAGRPGANQVSLSCRVSRGTTAVGVGGPEVSAVGPAQEPADVDPEDTCHVGTVYQASSALTARPSRQAWTRTAVTLRRSWTAICW